MVEDGKSQYNVMSDEYRDAMAYINKLYAEGLLDNQVFTQDATQFTAALDNADGNLIAVHPGGAIQADFTDFWAEQPGEWQNWVALDPVEGPDGVRLSAKSLTNYFGSCIGSVSVNCEYPEIAVALFDFLATQEATLVQSFGPQGVAWDYADESEGVALNGGTPLFKAIPMADDYDWLGNGFKQDYGENKAWASDAMIGSRTSDYRASQLVANPDVSVEYLLQSAAQNYSQYAPEDDSLVPNLVFEGQDAQTISEGTITIGGYVNQAAVQFITGAMNVEKDWDGYIEKLENMGVENYINIYQTYYDAYISNAQ